MMHQSFEERFNHHSPALHYMCCATQ